MVILNIVFRSLIAIGTVGFLAWSIVHGAAPVRLRRSPLRA